MSDARARDQMHLRIAGLCGSAIRPAIQPAADFLEFDGRTVLRITVPAGSEPVYYAGHVPYVRHLSQARPAEPHEVLQLVRVWLERNNSQARTPTELAGGALAYAAGHIIVLGEQLIRRRTTPHIERLRMHFRHETQSARRLAADSVSIELGWSAALLSFADAAEAVSAWQMTLGGYAQLEARVREAVQQAFALLALASAAVPQRQALQARAQQDLTRGIRHVEQELSRFEQATLAGSFDDYRGALSMEGREIAYATLWELRGAPDPWCVRMREAAQSLHLLETVSRNHEGYAPIQRALRDAVDALRAAERADDSGVHA